MHDPTERVNPLTTSLLRHRNQSVELQRNSSDCFLYDGEHWSLMSQGGGYESIG